MAVTSLEVGLQPQSGLFWALFPLPCLVTTHDSLSRSHLPTSSVPSHPSALPCLFRQDNVRHQMYLPRLGNVACPTDTALSQRSARMAVLTHVELRFGADSARVHGSNFVSIHTPAPPPSVHTWHTRPPSTTHLFHFLHSVFGTTHTWPQRHRIVSTKLIFTSPRSPCN